eukprot:3345889-Ditylum_brightwellii.AAC.1
MHMMTGFQGGEGLLCHYLCFLPIDCKNGGVMRIGVYGRPQGEEGDKIDANDAPMNNHTLMEKELVEY